MTPHKHSWHGLYCPQDGVGSSETIRELEAHITELQAYIDAHDPELQEQPFINLLARAEKAENDLALRDRQLDEAVDRCWKAEEALRMISGEVDSCGHSHGSQLHDVNRIMELAELVLEGEDPHVAIG